MTAVPQPLPLVRGIGFSTPAFDLYRWVFELDKELQTALGEAQRDAAALSAQLGDDFDCQSTSRTEMFSAAIQIFVAMTIEATVSLFIVAKFGESGENVFRGAPGRRLAKAFAAAGIAWNEQLDAVMKRRSDARNLVAHPYSNEHVAVGPPSELLSRRGWPDGSAEAARAAIADMRQFFELLQNSEDEAARFVSTL